MQCRRHLLAPPLGTGLVCPTSQIASLARGSGHGIVRLSEALAIVKPGNKHLRGLEHRLRHLLLRATNLHLSLLQPYAFASDGYGRAQSGVQA